MIAALSDLLQVVLTASRLERPFDTPYVMR